MLVTKQKFITILILIALLCSCGKSPMCWGDNQNKGIIESSVNFCTSSFLDSNYIIDSDIEMDSLFNSISNQYTNCEKPDLDFEKHTLIGQYASGSCEVKFIREVEKDYDNMQYVYIIKVRECGWCMSLGYSMNWVLVPKLPDDWTVKFEIE